MSNGKVKSRIATIYRASVEVPDHVYRPFGHSREYELRSSQLSGIVDASGSNSYSEVEEWAESTERSAVEKWVAGWETFIAELEVKAVPAGATHYKDTYGERQYFKRIETPHLNQASESWQKLVSWEWWNSDDWDDVGSGFSDRLLKRIGE